MEFIQITSTERQSETYPFANYHTNTFDKKKGPPRKAQPPGGEVRPSCGQEIDS